MNGKEEMHTKLWSEISLKENMVHLGVYVWAISKWILEKDIVQRWAFCEHGNEDSDAINSGNFLTS
jgi:hypothetical protein